MPGRNEPNLQMPNAVGPQQALRAVRRAQRLAEKGQISEAIRSLDLAIEHGADPYDCYLRQARLYQTLGQWGDALRVAEEAVTIAPDQLSAREAMVALYLETKDYRRAVRASRELLKIFPRHVPARDALGAAYIGLGDIRAAMRIANDLIRLDPSEPTHRFKKAVLCQHQGEVQMAVEEFERVLILASGSDLAGSAREQLDMLDIHQLHGILTLAAEDAVFRTKLARNSNAAIRERGFCLSEWGRIRLHQAVDDDITDIGGDWRPRPYH